MSALMEILKSEAFIGGTIVFLVGLAFALLAFWEKKKLQNIRKSDF